METKRTLRIVVASPGDVQPEREVLPIVIDELNRGIADERGLTLELSMWETDAYPGFHLEGPQGLIDPILKIEECDVLIGIFWKRFGTPTKDAQSGTEHEILRAYEAWKQNGSPQIMVYFNEKNYAPPKSTEELDQWRRVFEFKECFPKEGLWCAYKGKPQFEKLTRNHLTQLIRNAYPPPAQAQPSESQSVPAQIAGRSVEELTEAYRAHLAQRVSKIYIVGESESREMEQVFVKLNIIDEYRGASVQAEFLGLMDSEMRRRRDPLASFQIQGDAGPATAGDRIREVVKSDKLLSQRTQALISGAPGCGKTTLLRYLTLATLKDQRLPLFLELKSVNEEDFKQARNGLPQLLFDKAVAGPLQLQGVERARLEEYFSSQLRAGEAAIFLDGLDEVRGTGFFPALCTAVSEFVRSGDRNVLVISTRPYAFQARIEGLEEMEIAPLNRQQVEEFLKYYYGDDPSTGSLIQHLRRHRQLREFCSTPFLLSVIAQLHRSGQQIVQDRLELYRQIVLQLAVKLDSAKSLPLSRFHIPDPDGTLKLDFLKELACERLFMGYVNQEEVDREAARFVFTGDDLVEQAKQFLNNEKRPEINPRLLAADVKGTPLLREVGTDVYAFAHLTIQEYLAAVVLSRRDDCEKVFCRAYFNSPLANMEVLPMTMGLARGSEALYATLEGLPESWGFLNLRLRARGLSYTSPTRRTTRPLLLAVGERLLELVTGDQAEAGYGFAGLRDLSATNTAAMQPLVDRVGSLSHEDVKVRVKKLAAVWALGGERTTRILLEALSDPQLSSLAAIALYEREEQGAIDGLVEVLKKSNPLLRSFAVKILGRLGGERVVSALIEALKDKPSMEQYGPSEGQDGTFWLPPINGVGRAAVEALGQIGGEKAFQALLETFKDRDWDEDEDEDKNSDLREAAAEALGRLGDERAFEPLRETLKNGDEADDLREAVAEALGRIDPERARNALIEVLKYDDEDDDENELDEVAVDDDENEPGEVAADNAIVISVGPGPDDLSSKLLGQLIALDPDPSTETLVELLRSEASSASAHGAALLGRLGGERAVEELSAVLNDRLIDNEVREKVAAALGRLGGEMALEALLQALKPKDITPQAFAAADVLKDDEEYEEFTRAYGEAHRSGSLTFFRGKDGRVLVYDDEDLRVSVMAALGRLGDERAVEPLLEALQGGQEYHEDEEELREAAARALGQIGGERTIAGLVKALHDEDSDVRSAVAEALGEDGEEAVEALLGALNDKEDDVRLKAAKALGRLGDDVLSGGLVKALSRDDDFVRRKAAEVVGYYSEDPEVLDHLKRLAETDPADEVRKAASEARVKYERKLLLFGVLKK
jgi:HEAT repeat protein